MGRMVEIGPHSGGTGPSIVHFGWMRLPDSVMVGRSYAYNAYITATHSFVGETILHDPDRQYSGYVNVDVTPDNRALVGGHCDLMTGPQNYQTHIHFDECQGCADFANYTRVPDSLASYDQDPQAGTEAIWPKFFFQFGTDTVLHAFSEISATTTLQSLFYFRNAGYEGTGEWDYPPRIVDSVQCIAQDITGQRTGDRVCLAWFASPPYQEPSCDTCSGTTVYDGYLIGQMDNDIYIQVSNTQGVTWEPRQNISNVGIGQAGFKAYCDASILFDQSGYLHLIWHAVPWSADTCIDEGGFCFVEDFYLDASRVQHWSENIPYIRSIADHTYVPADSCGPPAWAVTVAKPGLAECNGRLYAMWAQFNDVPNGIHDDCAQWIYDQGVYYGGANSELWMSISADGGMTWDAQRNLTNTYTPHCGPNSAYECESDYWATISRWGKQIGTGEDWSGAVVVDPSGGTSPHYDYYLDIMYVNDEDAGGIVQAEGGWTYNDMKWFRVPCIEEVSAPLPVFSWHEVLFPTWCKVGTQLDRDLTVENLGNQSWTFSVSVVEDNGPSGWLGQTGFGTTLPSGLYNTVTGTVHMNQGGVVTTTMMLYGRVIFDGDDAGSPHNIEIELLVADTLVTPAWAVVNTGGGTDVGGATSLVISNNGNMGRAGYGGVNMDYYPEDCDSNAQVWLYEGTPVLARNGGADWNYQIWSATWYGDLGLYPVAGDEGPYLYQPCSGMPAEVYETGRYVTPDTAVAFERVYVAPADDSEFIIAYMKVKPGKGEALTGLLLGEMIDWDIPNDNNPDDPDRDGNPINTGGIDAGRNMLYQQGFECYCDDTLYPNNCVYNDARFAGNGFVGSYLNGSPRYSVPYGGFVGENDELWASGEGFIHSTMWTELNTSGLRGSDSVEDLSTAMCYEPALDLGVDDYYEVVTVMATIEDGNLAALQAAYDRAVTWFNTNGGIGMFADVDEANGAMDKCEGCCQNMGDMNHDGQVDALDVIFFVDYLWTPGSPVPPCDEEVDVNSDNQGDALDLIYLAEYIFQGLHDPLPDCP
ncbi:MAG: hypothetical protein JSW34_08105 [Candidatus Zixiibacteriota bacterium]|nr:MAG: hypothetical protein JSW34_08105 [candidate division Zixibacteria bacterium]